MRMTWLSSKSLRSPGLRLSLCFGAVCALSSGCDHDWDKYLPPNTGTGGMGVAGVCPEFDAGDPVVRVPTRLGWAMCIDPKEVTWGEYEAWLSTNPDPEEHGGGGGAGGMNSQPYGCRDINLSYVPGVASGTDGAGGGGGSAPTCTIGSHSDDDPVYCVDWCDAHAYCEAQAKRLCASVPRNLELAYADFNNPDASEWDNACTVIGDRAYPYGDYDPNACNGADAQVGAPVAVGTMPNCVTPQGVFDLSGNVAEWEDACDPSEGCRVRGGAFNNASAQIRCVADETHQRLYQDERVGIRCCAEVIR